MTAKKFKRMITVKNLSYTYPKSQSATIKNIDFEIAEGEIFGFLGPSGAGKSTTQKILIKLLSNFKGDILISGKKLGEWNSEFYNHIGVGFELPNHYLKLTALENLKFFSTFYAKKPISPSDVCYSTLSSLKITGRAPSVQLASMAPFSLIQG